MESGLNPDGDIGRISVQEKFFWCIYYPIIDSDQGFVSVGESSEDGRHHRREMGPLVVENRFPYLSVQPFLSLPYQLGVYETPLWLVSREQVCHFRQVD